MPLFTAEEEVRLKAAHEWALLNVSPPYMIISAVTILSCMTQLPLLLYTPPPPTSEHLILPYFLFTNGTAYWCFIMSYIYMAETIDSDRWCSWEKRLGTRIFVDEPSRSKDKLTVANKITFYLMGESAVFMASGILWKRLLLWLLWHGTMHPESNLTLRSCFTVLYDLVFVPCSFLASLIALAVGWMSFGTIGIALGEDQSLKFVGEELWPEICG